MFWVFSFIELLLLLLYLEHYYWYIYFRWYNKKNWESWKHFHQQVWNFIFHDVWISWSLLQKYFFCITINWTLMQIEKELINDCSVVSKVSWEFHILEISKCLSFSYNLHMKFTVFLKSSLLFNNLYCLFCL